MPNRKQGIKSLEGGMVGEVALYFEKVFMEYFFPVSVLERRSNRRKFTEISTGMFLFVK